LALWFTLELVTGVPGQRPDSGVSDISGLSHCPQRKQTKVKVRRQEKILISLAKLEDRKEAFQPIFWVPIRVLDLSEEKLGQGVRSVYS
jgi:hypothetical protein